MVNMYADQDASCGAPSLLLGGDTITIIEVAAQGPKGAQGIQGEEGEQGPAGYLTAFILKEIVVTALMLSNGGVELDVAWDMASLPILWVYGGPIQQPNVDYTLDGTTLTWGELPLGDVLEEGDVVAIEYTVSAAEI